MNFNLQYVYRHQNVAIEGYLRVTSVVPRYLANLSGRFQTVVLLVKIFRYVPAIHLAPLGAEINTENNDSSR